MTPIPFKEQNCVFAENQDEYQNLPAFRADDGQIVCCWKLSIWERMRLLVTGRIWQSILTFNKPLQPQHLGIESPFEEVST